MSTRLCDRVQISVRHYEALLKNKKKVYNNSVKNYATFGQRLLGLIIDLLIIIFAPIIFFSAITPLTSFYANWYAKFAIDNNYPNSFWPTALPIVIPLLIPLLIWYFGYSIIFLAWKGQTPGMMLVKIKLLEATGKKAGFVTLLLRETVGSFITALLPFGIGFLWMLWDNKKQIIADKVANTVVVKQK